jgi:hypothetical protein
VSKSVAKRLAAQMRMDTGLGKLPVGVQEDIKHLVNRVGYHGCELNNGHTALYWHLVAVLNAHIKEKK